MNKKIAGILIGLSLASNVCFANGDDGVYNVGDNVTSDSLSLSMKNGYAIILEEDWVTIRIRCSDMKVVEVDYSILGYRYKNLIIGSIYTEPLINSTLINSNDFNGNLYITYDEKKNDKYYTRVKLDYDNRIMGITFIDKML